MTHQNPRSSPYAAHRDAKRHLPYMTHQNPRSSPYAAHREFFLKSYPQATTVPQKNVVVLLPTHRVFDAIHSFY
jgi:hypothetical protein